MKSKSSVEQMCRQIFVNILKRNDLWYVVEVKHGDSDWANKVGDIIVEQIM